MQSSIFIGTSSGQMNVVHTNPLPSIGVGNPSAGSALALPIFPVPNDVGVRFVKFVATETAGLARIDGGDPLPAEDIRRLSDGAKVRLVDTMTDAALMIELQAVWNRPVGLFVREDVRADRLPIDVELPIAVFV
jgi:hypothetical protein